MKSLKPKIKYFCLAKSSSSVRQYTLMKAKANSTNTLKKLKTEHLESMVGSVLRTEVAPTVSVLSVVAVAQIGATLVVSMLCPSAFVLNHKSKISVSLVVLIIEV